jgi:putative DNA primase/helicase
MVKLTEASELPEIEDILNECIFTGDAFRKHTFPAPTFLMEPWLTNPSYNLIYGPKGLGKTFVTAGIAVTVATGGKMLDWKAPKPEKVLYIDGEMDCFELQERIERMSMGLNYDNLHILSVPDMVRRNYDAPVLRDERVQRYLIDKLTGEGFKMVVLDNVSALFPSGDENKKESWENPDGFMKELRAKGVTVILVHHCGKLNAEGRSSGPRGTSSIEDALNMSIELEPVPGHDPEDGCALIMHWRKNRSVIGTAVKKKQIELLGGRDPRNPLYFEYMEGRTETQSRIIKAYKATPTMTQEDIAKAVGSRSGTVSKVLKEYRLNSQMSSIDSLPNVSKPSKKRALQKCVEGT